MKVTSATVRLVLKKNKVNKNGEPNTIATYVKQITRDEEIAEMVEVLPI